MNHNGLYQGMLPRLEEVNLSARARRQAESQMGRAAVILQMLIGKASANRTAVSNASATH